MSVMLQHKLMGLPAWGWGALSAVLLVAVALERRPTTPSANATADTDPRVPPMIAIATPQETTPYNLPVTRPSTAKGSMVTVG